MAINASLRVFGARSPALQQRPGVAACRWTTRQQAAMKLQIRQCVAGGGSSVALGGSVERSSSRSFIDELDTKQKKQVSVFVDSLLDWNQRMNLTAVTERDAVMERHIMDSLALLPIMESAYSAHCCSSETFDERLKVVDVGSGAGLPGLILAIARPGASYAVGCHIQDCGRDERFREAYDVAVARAVAEMRVLSELCLPLVRVGGLFVAAKGPNPQQEVEASRKAIRVLGASLLSISTVASEGPLGLRTAITCHKQKLTPAKYPRSPGTPGKHPI